MANYGQFSSLWGQYATDNNNVTNYKTVESQLNKLYDSNCTVTFEQRTKERIIKDELLQCIRNKQKELQNKDPKTLLPLEKKAQRCPTIWESQTIVGGSRMKRLALEGSDYDLLVAFSPALVAKRRDLPNNQYALLDKDDNPHIAHKELHSFICLVRSAMKSYSPKARVVKTRVSAEVSDFQGLSFDVLPSYRIQFQNGPMEFIQSRAEPDLWEDCHRYEELSQVTDYKQKFPEYTKCVRILKWFRDWENFDDLPSFALQRLVENYVDNNPILPPFRLVECIRYCLNLLRKGLEGNAKVEDSFSSRDLLENLRKKPKKAQAKANILVWVTRMLSEIENGKLTDCP